MAVSTALVLALALGWAVTFRPTALGGPATFTTVAGTSMEPTYDSGDLVVARRSDTYDIGDVVVYFVGPDLVIHRIVGGDADGYATQGDNRGRPDPWTPTDDHIVGKAWIHLPQAGTWLASSSEPHIRALLVAAVAVVAVGPGAVHVRRRRRRSSRRSPMDSVPRDPAHRRVRRRSVSAPPRTLRMLVGGSVLLALGVALALASWTRPTEGVRVEQAGHVDHRFAFEYTAAAASPSLVYPEGTVGPVVVDDVEMVEPTERLQEFIGDDAEVQEPVARPPLPLYRELIERLHVEIAYTGASSDPVPALTATVHVDAVAATPEGWEHRVPLVEAQPVEALTWEGSVVVELGDIDQVMARQAELVGGREGAYRLSVEAVVTLEGQLAGQPIEDALTGELAFETAGSTLEPASGLETSDTVSVGEQVAETTTVGPGFLAIRTSVARWASAVLILLSLAVVAFSTLARGGLLGGDPSVRVRTRYGSMLVTIPSGTPVPGRVVPVGTVRELVRLAKAEGGFVLHERYERRLHRYLVPAGDVVYVHVLGPGGDGPDGGLGEWPGPDSGGDADRADDPTQRLWS